MIAQFNILLFQYYKRHVILRAEYVSLLILIERLQYVHISDFGGSETSQLVRGRSIQLQKDMVVA